MPFDSGESRTLEQLPRPRGRPRDPAIDRLVLEATLDELSANGYEGMSIDGIAARAGVSKPTIYRRWADKPALAIGAIAILVSQEGPPSTGDPLTDLSRQLHAAHRNLERSGSVPLLGTLLAEKERHPEFLEMYRDRLLRPRRETLIGLLEEARERGEIRKDADIETASLQLIGFLIAKYLSGDPLDDDWAVPAVALVLEALR